MEPDNDPQEQALEIHPEKAPAQAAHDSPGNAAEKTGEEAPEAGSPRPSLFRRLLEACWLPLRYLKRFLRTGALWITNASRSILKRLRSRAETPHEEDREEDRHGDNSSETRVARKKTAPPPVPEAIKAIEPRSPVRSFFVYLLVLIIGGIAGMTFSFALLSKMITNQAEKIGDQRDEIAQMENQLSRVQQAEAKSRLENMEYQKKLSEVENQLNSAIQKPGGNTPPPTTSGGNPTAPAAVRPPVSRKTGDCTLESGKIGDNLTRCIDEFNRK